MNAPWTHRRYSHYSVGAECLKPTLTEMEHLTVSTCARFHRSSNTQANVDAQRLMKIQITMVLPIATMDVCSTRTKPVLAFVAAHGPTSTAMVTESWIALIYAPVTQQKQHLAFVGVGPTISTATATAYPTATSHDMSQLLTP